MTQRREESDGAGLKERMYRYLVQKQLAEPGDHVIAGVSGGADSVCLLLLLSDLKERAGYTLSAVHVEHGIRGEESVRDTAFTEALCSRLGIACEVFHVSVPEYAARQKAGTEEAARALRYDCLKRAARAYPGGRVKIALAHHADDNAETVLLWLARGSGVRGLGGIRPGRELDPGVTVIRPLLFAQRAEILDELAIRGEPYCVDATNAQTQYSRNRIRHEVLPELKRVNPQAVSHIAACAGMLAELSDYLEHETDRIFPVVCGCADEENSGERRTEEQGEGRVWLIREKPYREYPHVLQKALVRRVLCAACGSRDLGSVHIESVCAFFGHAQGKRLSLPHGVTAVRTCDGIRVGSAAYQKRPESVTGTAEEYRITEGDLARAERGEEVVILLPDAQLRLRIFLISEENGGNKYIFGKKKYTKWLDYDRINGSLLIRRRRSGDYLTIDAEGHRTKLKKYLIGEKIPADDRGRLWLLTKDAHVLWVIGRRISADVRISQDTHRILEVRMEQRGTASAGRLYVEDKDED